MTGSGEQPNIQSELYLLVRQCQEIYAAWRTAEDEALRQQLRAEQQTALEELWNQLQPDLLRLARRWRRSGMAPDLDSLAKSLFVHIIEVLPTKHFDPGRNIRSLLLLIVQRDTIDEYRKSYSHGPRSQSSSANSSSPSSTNMWSAPHMAYAPYPPEGYEPTDTTSYDAETMLVAQIDQQQLLREIWAYWPNQLSAIDLRIVQLRWQTDPPRPFAEIAQQLGSGWEADAVRQRHHRIVKETREFLRNQGFLD